jgi:hypothetical protein
VCSSSFDCCDGVCCEAPGHREGNCCPAGFRCIDGACEPPDAECARDGDCSVGEVCTDGVCEAVACGIEGLSCASDPDCCGGLVCSEGTCRVSDDTGGLPDDEVTQLPDTGVGPAGSDRSSLPGLASLLAGAAALLAGKSLRKGRDEVSQTGDEAS